MIHSMMWRVLMTVFLLTLMPWAVAYFIHSDSEMVWECHFNFEKLILFPSDSRHRSVGTYSQFYYGDGTGLGRLSGRLEDVAANGDVSVSTVQRFINFNYAHVEPYLKKVVRQITRNTGDTIQGAQPLVFLKKPGDEVYLQVMKLGRNVYALGLLGIPSYVCQGRSMWQAPQFR